MVEETNQDSQTIKVDGKLYFPCVLKVKRLSTHGRKAQRFAYTHGLNYENTPPEAVNFYVPVQMQSTNKEFEPFFENEKEKLKMTCDFKGEQETFNFKIDESPYDFHNTTTETYSKCIKDQYALT